MKALLTPFLLLPLLVQAQVSETAVRQCRAISDVLQRLACYDQLPLSTPLAAATPAAPPSPAPAPAAAAATAPAKPAAPAANSFGLERPADEPQQVVSSIEGLFEGWGPRERIRLANGQVWQVVDDSSAVYGLRNPKVTIKRGALSGFVMDIEGANKRPRVRRVE
jgi:hypothetical protein